MERFILNLSVDGGGSMVDGSSKVDGGCGYIELFNHVRTILTNEIISEISTQN